MRVERVIDFQNIVPGQIAIMKPALGPTYEAFYIALGGGLLITHMDRIQLKVDGKVVYETTGADQLAHNLYEGLPNATNQIVLDFTQPNAKSSGTPKGPTSAAAEMLLTCLPSNLFQMMTLEFTLNASAPGGSTMVARAQVSEPSGNPYIIKQQKASYAFPSTGDQYLPLPTGPNGALVKQIFLMQSNYGAAWAGSTAYALNAYAVNGGNLYQVTTAGTSASSGGPTGTGAAITDGTVTWKYVSAAGSISGIEVRNNGVIITEVTPADLSLIHARYGKVEQNGMTVLDYFLQGLRAKLLNTVAGKNTYLKLTTTGGPVNLNVYNRIIDPVNRK
ncbi:major capsid protein P2 [Cupriavidus sp. CuC1]|uniref:major capsid protein P2 n=1 Tax=Cupriavidus sp. CuC1 TaxID=3373131 RepID=UPI0037D981CB